MCAGVDLLLVCTASVSQDVRCNLASLASVSQDVCCNLASLGVVLVQSSKSCFSFLCTWFSAARCLLSSTLRGLCAGSSSLALLGCTALTPAARVGVGFCLIPLGIAFGSVQQHACLSLLRSFLVDNIGSGPAWLPLAVYFVHSCKM